MTIRQMIESDIPAWLSLSHEHDAIVRELVPDLTHWYEGNGIDPTFDTYMRAKIVQREALMACDDSGRCMGIVAFSRKNNRITFFGVALDAPFDATAEALLQAALGVLDESHEISITVLKSRHSRVHMEKEFLLAHGFAPPARRAGERRSG